ncbi:MAG TPA: single-stranded-DNA-specific exonuclease RecJ [Flavobacteriales bacterium]|nr:single-stranded-DNA-specific exonuclease RecJ [Flavobacteriales bacterium]HRE73823.1 single-stranded-DNA-specific exonuclease RecJ [Flavobacteriales bacterium]HRE96860.1 single-stranded-DNA-specific exonuclease RecJ [Flavobacteriales bacterium]HRJ38519.1 single-stranded-DNA-specific exonuclease RecJ [Flavobacteriales bacterium]
MEKRWVFDESAKVPEKSAAAIRLEQELNLPPALARALVRRGIGDFQEAKCFFRPELENLHDPFLMRDMDKAVERLQQAMSKGENILIYGDYDVDGTTSVALVYSFLASKYHNIDFYIPDRYTEGYGISFKGIDVASDSDVSLIIALDCGIKSNDKIDYARSKGIDFIICDHHRPGDILPEAAAVLDPKREDCNYPYKELCGCGVGFKLMQALCTVSDYSLEELYNKLDLTAVAIAADIVPITGENRILAYHGLQKINSNPSVWVRAILKLAGKQLPVDISNLVFILAPRINAAGRIDSGRNAVELLIASNEEEAINRGMQLDKHNADRKEFDRNITREALSIIEENEELKSAKTTVLYRENWHKGVIGIVASRLTESYYRPTILLTLSNGKLTGSARSVRDYDVYEAIEACSHLLEQFGGHKYAAGLTLAEENLDAFRAAFESFVASTIEEHMLIPSIDVEDEIDLEVLRTLPGETLPKFYRILKQFAPFGPGNMNPVFVTHQLRDSGMARTLKEEHLKLQVYSEHDPRLRFDAIAFGMAKHLNRIVKGEPFSLAYTLEENNWNGKVSLQMMVKDVRF